MTEEKTTIQGTFRALMLFDVAEEIDLSLLRSTLGVGPSKREPAFRRPAPNYVRFERPPVVEYPPARQTDDGNELQARIRYFDYGVASVELQLSFHLPWESVVGLANRSIMAAELERRARTVLTERLAGMKEVLQNPYKEWVSEDYYVVQIDPILLPDQSTLSAEELVRNHGSQIAQIVRGEGIPLSNAEQQDVLQSCISYYPSDLLVVGWIAAFVYDTPPASLPTIDLLEYANTQLLEFRYYDEVLTRVLADVYKRLDQKRGIWGRWKLAKEAGRLNTIRLDYQELAERTDNAIKFLSDMFYARAYRLASTRIGVQDYRSLVTEKLITARDLYESMITEFHQARAFVLELMVVIILLIEIVFLFKGKG
jgi:hypothetical protein